MIAFTLDTLRQTTRSPGGWILLGLGFLAGWAGLELAILTLGKADLQAPGVIVGSAQVTAVLLSLWILSGQLEQDRVARLRVAADCTGPGPLGRQTGRLLGSALAGGLGGCAVATALLALWGRDFDGALAPQCLYSTIFEVALLASAWGLLAATVWPGGPVMLTGLLLWCTGHLPWGTQALLPGPLGRGLAMLLPGPRDPAALGPHLVPTLAAATGLALVALAVGNTRPRGA